MRVSLSDVTHHEWQRALYQGQPVTGIVEDVTASGRLLGDAEYVDGIQHGLERGYRADGSVESQDTYDQGALVESREWHVNGQLARLETFSQGRLTGATSWDEEGNVTADT